MQELHEAYPTQGDKGIEAVTSNIVSSNEQGSEKLVACSSLLVANRCRPVALTARASDSKSEGWGFESLLACQTKPRKNA